MSSKPSGGGLRFRADRTGGMLPLGLIGKETDSPSISDDSRCLALEF